MPQLNAFFLALLLTASVTGFPLIAPLNSPRRRLLLRLRDSSSSSEAPFFASDNASTMQEEDEENEPQQPQLDAVDDDDELLQGATVLDLSLHPHRPLGCTLEESLPDGTHVFVSKVRPDSHGQAAGLQVGDVILACSDLFGDGPLAMVHRDGGLDQVKSLVQARPDHEPLELRIARGSQVLPQHEQALVELCANPGASATEVENCLLEYITEVNTLPTEDVASNNSDNDDEECDPEQDENCLLDSAFDLWNEEFDQVMPPPVISKPEDDDDEQAPQAKKVKPWSSRSSPSGTFVRDPATGKMRNIDA